MASFVEFAASHGLLIDELFTDGCIHRVPTDDDKSGKRSGAYACHGKYGQCWNWKLGGDAEHWCEDSGDGLPVDPHEREIATAHDIRLQQLQDLAASDDPDVAEIAEADIFREFWDRDNGE